MPAYRISPSLALTANVVNNAIARSIPDIAPTLMAPTTDQTIASGYSAYVPDFYEIASTFMLEIETGSVFEIG